MSVPNELKFVVVGTGRHGSGYISKLLTRAGIPTGHEQFYGFNARSDGLIGDSSWLAVPHLEKLHQAGVEIFHQVRHPEATLRSMLGGQMFGQGRNNKWFKTRKQFLPMTGDDMIDAMRIYVQWNLACERWAKESWKVEAPISHGLLDLVVVSDLGGDVHELYTALKEIPTDVNHHARHPAFTLDDLPHTADRDAVMWMGERYGYL